MTLPLILDPASQASLLTVYASGRAYVYVTLPYYCVMLLLALTALRQKRRAPRSTLVVLACLLGNTTTSLGAQIVTAITFLAPQWVSTAASCNLLNHFLAAWFVLAQFCGYNLLLARSRAVDGLGAPSRARVTVYRVAYVLTLGVLVLVPLVFVFWTGVVVGVVDYDTAQTQLSTWANTTAPAVSYTLCVMRGTSWLNWMDLSLDSVVSAVYLALFVLPVLDVAARTRDADVLGSATRRVRRVALTNLALSSAAISVTIADMAWMAWANDAATYAAPTAPTTPTSAPRLYLEGVAQILGTTNMLFNNFIFHCLVHVWLPRPLDKWYRHAVARVKCCGFASAASLDAVAALRTGETGAHPSSKTPSQPTRYRTSWTRGSFIAQSVQRLGRVGGAFGAGSFVEADEAADADASAAPSSQVRASTRSAWSWRGVLASALLPSARGVGAEPAASRPPPGAAASAAKPGGSK